MPDLGHAIPPPEPMEIAVLVESYVRREYEDAADIDSRSPLDEAGVYRLHGLAAQIYALGHSHGWNVATYRCDGATNRDHRADTAGQ